MHLPTSKWGDSKQNDHRIIIGFMLFAMFFGAGNLIFPPGLGFQSGDYFWMAIIGFVITGVGLPLVGVIAGSISKGGAIFCRLYRRIPYNDAIGCR